MNNSPTISVVMSVYNAEKYLAKAIKSIISQTFKDFEFIIINDASTDRSVDIIRNFDDERIVLVSNEQNLGLTKSLNFGIKMAKGKYIARMDADDISHLARLQEQLDIMQSDSKIAICGTAGSLIDSRDNIIGEIPIGRSKEEILGNILFFNPFIHPSLMMQKSILDEVGGYNESFLKAQDYELILRLVGLNYEVMNIDKKLISYRNHEESISSQRNSSQEDFATKAIQNFIQSNLKTNISQNSIKAYRKIVLSNHSESNIFLVLICFCNLKKLKNAFSNKYKDEGIMEVFRNTLIRIVNTQFKSEDLRKLANLYLGI